MQVIEVKAIIFVGLYLVAFVCVMIPRATSKIPERYQQKFISLAQCASGGVFLAAAMLDMFPDGLQDFYNLMPDQILLSVQITATIFTAGFLLIFFIEKVVFVELLHPSNKHRNKVAAAEATNPSPLTKTESDKNIQSKKKHKHKHDEKSDCEHEAFTFDCFSDIEAVHSEKTKLAVNQQFLSTGNHYDDANGNLDPVAILETTLTHGFGHLDINRDEKIKVAMEVIEDTFSIRLAKMAEDNPLMYISLVLVLSVHTFIAGIALGVCTTVDCIIPVFIGIISHMWVVALALGLTIHRSKVSIRTHFSIAAFWSSALPCGLLLGTILTAILSDTILLAVQAFFVTLAAGTFIYVAIVDIILQEFTVQHMKYAKFFLLVLGYVALGCLLIFV